MAKKSTTQKKAAAVVSKNEDIVELVDDNVANETTVNNVSQLSNETKETAVENTDNNNTMQRDNVNSEELLMRKAGRTLLVKSKSQLNVDTFNYSGLQSKVLSKNNTVFLTFDTVNNSVTAYNDLRKNRDLSVKFSYYRVFFTYDGYNDKTTYDDVKKQMVSYVEKSVGSKVVYYKLYVKNKALMGTGDMTLDSLDGMTKLISKSGSLKSFNMNGLTGTFYRYNKLDKQVKTN